MALLLSLLLLALFLALIVGLINPKKVLAWDKSPSRFKVFGYWFGIQFVFLFAIGLTSGDKKPLQEFKKESSEIIYTEKSIKKEISQKNIEETTVLQIKNCITDVENFNNSNFRGSIDKMQMELLIFNSYRVIIENNEHSDNLEIKKLAKTLKDKVIKMQLKEYPLLRKEYTKIANGLMWELDIDVSLSGNRNIVFSGGLFAANKNKKDFNDKIYKALNEFRFSQSRYCWYKGADEYTYWEIYKGKDSDLTIIN